MKVEVLYVAGCPSHPAAVKLLQDILRAEGIEAAIAEVLVANQQVANDLGFLGSPTIRINGQDVEPESSKTESFALNCRLYPGSQQIGLPPADAVRRALIEARKGAGP